MHAAETPRSPEKNKEEERIKLLLAKFELKIRRMLLLTFMYPDRADEELLLLRNEDLKEKEDAKIIKDADLQKAALQKAIHKMGEDTYTALREDMKNKIADIISLWTEKKIVTKEEKFDEQLRTKILKHFDKWLENIRSNKGAEIDQS